jgi:hypothetical protein
MKQLQYNAIHKVRLRNIYTSQQQRLLGTDIIQINQSHQSINPHGLNTVINNIDMHEFLGLTFVNASVEIEEKKKEAGSKRQ